MFPNFSLELFILRSSTHTLFMLVKFGDKIPYILKIEDYIILLNCFFVKDVLEKRIKIFQIFLTKTKEVHYHTTRHSSHNTINHQQFNTRQYGLYSVRNQGRITWNEMQNKLSFDMLTEPPTKVKRTLRKYFSNIYHIPTIN